MKTTTGRMMIFAALCRLCRRQGTHSKTKNRFRSIAILAALVGLLLGWPELGKTQCAVDLNPTTTRLNATDLMNQATVDMKFAARQTAANQSNINCTFPGPDKCTGKPDRGENYAVQILAQLASPDINKVNAAIASLMSVQRGDFGQMGSTLVDPVPFSLTCLPDFFLSSALGAILNNVVREGEGDVAMLALITSLYYGINHNLFSISSDVVNHALPLIDLQPGPGSVETLSFGFNTIPVCGAVCAATVNPLLCGGCLLTVPQLNVTSPETENHLNNIYVSQYLAYQLLFQRSGNTNSAYDTSRNGYKPLLLSRLKGFVHNDFIEYNARPYQDYTMFALLSLYSYALDHDVQAAAKMVLDYVSAKVAVSSSDALRSTPYRRKNDSKYFGAELLQPSTADPQTAFFMMLAGVTDALEANGNTTPGPYAVEFGWAANTDYRIPPSILDLFVNRAHRTFYQFFHYANTGSNDELYYSSPSYLISAGGHPNQNAYAKDLPSPVDLIASLGQGLLNFFPGLNLDVIKNGQLVDPSGDDLGVAVPTTLMPTGVGVLHSRDQLIHFYDSGGENLCVWRNFACGLNPVIPANYTNVDPGPISTAQPGSGSWLFYDESGGSIGTAGGPCTGPKGYYVAVYQQDAFGFFEVYDTCANPNGLTGLNDFANRVYANNNGQMFSQTGVNTYKVIAGNVIQFTADAHIVSVDGNQPYDPTRTNGDIINDNGQGLVTISNPSLGTTLTLDATPPPTQISVPGPVTFPDTCVGTTSLTTLNVCNAGNGNPDLTVFNIPSQNRQFQVTPPTIGYPVEVGSNFCFPFQASFTPVAATALSSKVTISSSDPVVPELNVDISGNGIQQSIATVISNGGNFGNVCIGSSTDLNLTINNNGGCDLVVNSITSDSMDFTIAQALHFPLTIHSGGSLAVPVRFQPATLGAKMGNITITSNDANAPAGGTVVKVSGNVPAPIINATIANNGAFGNVCAGNQSDLTLQVINQGLCPLTISGIGAVGGSSFILPSVTNSPVKLAANGSINLPIRFQPPAYGTANYITCSNTMTQNASVVIQSDDPKYPAPGGFVTPVNGIEGCPSLQLSPQNLTGAFAFPPTVSDPSGSLGCYTDRQITIGNAGICPLYINSLIAGPSNTFNVTNPSLPLTIAPGAAPVPTTIRFRPTNLSGQLSNAPDQQTGTLTIVSNDPIAGDNAAGLCGEPVYHSGIRALVVNAAGQPVNPVKTLSLASKGLKPNISQTESPATPATAPNICGNSITYTLDNETLPPAGTTGNNPNASYTLTARQGSTSATMSFTLGQCEFKQPILQIR